MAGIILCILVVAVVLSTCPCGSIVSFVNDSTGQKADEEIGKVVTKATAEDPEQVGSSDAVVEQVSQDILETSTAATVEIREKTTQLLNEASVEFLAVPDHPNWKPQAKALEAVLKVLHETTDEAMQNIEQTLSAIKAGDLNFSNASLDRLVTDLNTWAVEASNRVKQEAQEIISLLRDAATFQISCINISLDSASLDLLGWRWSELQQALPQVIQLVHLLCQKMKETQTNVQRILEAIGKKTLQEMLIAQQEVETMLSSAYEKVHAKTIGEIRKLIQSMEEIMDSSILVNAREAVSNTDEAIQSLVQEACRRIDELLPSINKLRLDIDVAFEAEMSVMAVSDVVSRIRKEIEKAAVPSGCCDLGMHQLLLFMGMIKILVSFGQIVSTFSVSFPSVPWPESFVQIWQTVSVLVNLNFLDAFSFECATGSFTFYHTLLVTVCGCTSCLLLIVAGSFLRYASARDVNDEQEADIQGSRAVFLFLFVVFPGVNATILQVVSYVEFCVALSIFFDLYL